MKNLVVNPVENFDANQENHRLCVQVNACDFALSKDVRGFLVVEIKCLFY